MRVSAGGQGCAWFELPIGTEGESTQAFLTACPDSGHRAETEKGEVILKAIRS